MRPSPPLRLYRGLALALPIGLGGWLLSLFGPRTTVLADPQVTDWEVNHHAE